MERHSPLVPPSGKGKLRGMNMTWCDMNMNWQTFSVAAQHLFQGMASGKGGRWHEMKFNRLTFPIAAQYLERQASRKGWRRHDITRQWSGRQLHRHTTPLGAGKLKGMQMIWHGISHIAYINSCESDAGWRWNMIQVIYIMSRAVAPWFILQAGKTRSTDQSRVRSVNSNSL